ncbi:uncharacterized protein LOC134816616 isoform X2 [Bolinopsis microptera]|uniref:uncharacterized protein LOC134816616 isoform X2 n=1 Tax=Bolinopsis microptera TaxID=2820187 RepID=UPI00307AB59E
MVADMAGPLNAIKRTVIDGKSVILLDGPPQVLSWNEFKSICKLFEEVDWFDIAEVTGADFTSSMQTPVNGPGCLKFPRQEERKNAITSVPSVEKTVLASLDEKPISNSTPLKTKPSKKKGFTERRFRKSEKW